ncbi:MAG: hypothetical protein LBT97_03290 [Planctomycetota bacterium]|jgi:hypothetical protein|nr:hypothetical protein [Planctomycetota bacterium]
MYNHESSGIHTRVCLSVDNVIREATIPGTTGIGRVIRGGVGHGVSAKVDKLVELAVMYGHQNPELNVWRGVTGERHE